MKFQISEKNELRPFVESDAEAVFETIKANLGHLHTFLHWATDEYSLENAHEFIKRSQIAAAEEKNQTFGIFINGNFAGSIGFVQSDQTSRRTEIGYWIAKNYEGQGTITKSCRKLLNYSFDTLDMNRVEIRRATENARSRAIPEKLNFKLDGILRQSEWRHSRFYDMAIYSMLKAEWKETGN